MAIPPRALTHRRRAWFLACPPCHRNVWPCSRIEAARLVIPFGAIVNPIKRARPPAVPHPLRRPRSRPRSAAGPWPAFPSPTRCAGGGAPFSLLPLNPRRSPPCSRDVPDMPVLPYEPVLCKARPRIDQSPRSPSPVCFRSSLCRALLSHLTRASHPRPPAVVPRGAEPLQPGRLCRQGSRSLSLRSASHHTINTCLSARGARLPVLKPPRPNPLAPQVWSCPLCFTRNHFPQHYAEISETNLPGAPSLRPTPTPPFPVPLVSLLLSLGPRPHCAAAAAGSSWLRGPSFPPACHTRPRRRRALPYEQGD